MIPYTIRLLLKLSAEKQQQIEKLNQQIIEISQNLSDEIHRLLIDAKPERFADTVDLWPDLGHICTEHTNPIGYCVYATADPSQQACIFCTKPDETDQDETDPAAVDEAAS
jgi:hypothetical protein